MKLWDGLSLFALLACVFACTFGVDGRFDEAYAKGLREGRELSGNEKAGLPRDYSTLPAGWYRLHTVLGVDAVILLRMTPDGRVPYLVSGMPEAMRGGGIIEIK